MFKKSINLLFGLFRFDFGSNQNLTDLFRLLMIFVTQVCFIVLFKAFLNHQNSKSRHAFNALFLLIIQLKIQHLCSFRSYLNFIGSKSKSHLMGMCHASLVFANWKVFNNTHRQAMYMYSYLDKQSSKLSSNRKIILVITKIRI